FGDEVVEALPGQQRHHEEGLLFAPFIELADVVDFSDIGVNNCRLYTPFFEEKVSDCPVFDVEERLERDMPFHERVVRPVDDAHAPSAKNFAEFITPLNLSRRGQSKFLPA